MAKRRGVPPERTRTVALVGHRGAGKTSLAEALLHTAGVVRRPGSVELGTSLLDHHDEERRHRMSVRPGYAWLPWRDCMVHLMDTPGNDALAHERALALCGADAAIVVVDATAGVEVGTERVLAEVRRTRLPLVVALAKTDRCRDLDGVMEHLERSIGTRVVLLQLPLTDEDGELCGVIDLEAGRAIRYDPDAPGQTSAEPIPGLLQEAAELAWERAVESVALTDDALLEYYLEYLELAGEAVREGLAKAVANGLIVPVLLTAATAGVGAGPLLDAVVELLPSPVERRVVQGREYDGHIVPVPWTGPFVAQLLSTQPDAEGRPYHVLRVFSGEPPRDGRWTNGQTGRPSRVRKLYQLRGRRRAVAASPAAGALVATWDPLDGRPGDTFTVGWRIALPQPELPPPMMAWALAPRAGQEPAALAEALQQLVHEDAALALHADDVAGTMLLAGSCETHLQLAVRRLEERFEVQVTHSLPPVGYRETPAGSVQGVKGMHLREDRDGLVEEYGLCLVDLVPGAHEEQAQVVDRIEAEDDVPRRYRPAIDEGAQLGMRHGPTAGYPVVGVQVHVTGGSYDMLQSTDDHFRLAGEKAVRNALQKAGTRLLEPWWSLEVRVPPDTVGDLLADISGHRGRVLGLDVHDKSTRVQAHVPYRELRTFASRLKALANGRGTFTSELSHYEPVPHHLVQEAIAESPFAQQRRGNHGRPDGANRPLSRPRTG